mgnify:CR=1 FL=1|tara:strand:- start:397 stop:711 length:315 start_codon:yes stop_codon:yes gene_type:complete
MDDYENPSYDLEQIKKSFDQPEKLRMTSTAETGLDELCFTKQNAVDAIQRLSLSDFYKSMSPVHAKFTAWQDVYTPKFKGVKLYIKFQVNMRKEVIVSFKRNQS